MKFNFKPHSLFTIFALSVFASCSSSPNNEYSANTNASPKITNAETALRALHQDQGDVFAPESYKKAMSALEDAKEERADDSNNENILEAVQNTEKLTLEAKRQAAITMSTLPGVAEARQAALSAHVEEFAQKDFVKTEKELAKFAKEVETGKINKPQVVTKSLLKQYKTLQTQATLKWKLNPSQNLIKKASDEGARDNAPISLSEAKYSLENATALIKKDPLNMAAIDPATSEAEYHAEKLLRITREAKAAGGPKSEAIILKGEAQQRIISKQKQAIKNSHNETAVAESEIQNLAGVKNLQDKVAVVSKKFNADEADVYQQGKSVIIRLKGIQFPNNKFEIPSSGFATLKKVQESILAFDSPSVKIEGHTDASGSKAINLPLSQHRAESVKEYLTAGLGMESTDLEVSGYGSDKPLGSNKTAAGRAQNRRIDIVIEEM